VIGQYKSVVHHYTEIFSMTRYSDFSYSELIKLPPYELEIFMSQTIKAVKKEKEARESK
jgi:hypothetical protein